MNTKRLLYIFFAIILFLSNTASISAASAGGQLVQSEGDEKNYQINAPTSLTCESFDAFTPGSKIGTYSGWYDAGDGPVVTSGNGVAGSIGLAAGKNIFTWIANPFDWNATDFSGFVAQTDFKTDNSGHLDDDRVGWMITNSSVDSTNFFGVQLDPGGSGYNIEGYWKNTSGGDARPTIANLPTLGINTWYRLRLEVTKLSATSAYLEATLTELDSSGNPLSEVASGSVDTSTLGSNIPNTKYFTATNIWPSYKNYTEASAPADNTCFEVITGAPPVQYTLTVSDDGNGSVTLNPTGGIYNEGTVVTLTPVPNSGFEFDNWGGDNAGDLTDNGDGTWSITMDADKAVTANFVVTDEVTVTFQEGVDSYAGTIDTYIMEDESTTSHGALTSVEWDADDPSGSGLYKYALIRFDDIFGSGTGQIPPGATIQSATLKYLVYNTGDSADLNEVTIDWDEDETWDSFGGDSGVQVDEYGSLVGSASGASTTLQSIDVTTSLAAWSVNPLTNYGWIFRPADTDGVDFRSSEYSTIASRPSLEVTYLLTGEQYNLNVSVPGGGGSVTLNPPGGVYYEGAIVQLTANPAVGYTFSEWGGDLSGSDNPAYITMDDDKDVTATFVPVPPVDLTVNIVGNGSVLLDPSGGTYDVGTVVELTAEPDSGWYFSGWSDDLSGNTNPTNITMDEAKTVTATFLELPPEVSGICEGFESGFTIGEVIGTHAEWFDSGSGPVVTSGNGLMGTIGLAPASSIFTWVEHPFDWNDPGFESISFSMDFQTNASGYFDDDRLGWMISDENTTSTNFFGVQLDTVSGGDGGIVTYWRDESDTRIQTPIVSLSALSANTWYRFEATISKLTDTSAKIDVSLVELDSGGNPTGTPYVGSVDDTSAWADGAPNLEYFTAEQMWPAFKNYSAIVGAADNACFDVSSARFAFLVSSDWHTSDSNPNADITAKVAQIANWINNPTEEMPAPEFMVINGDFPNLSQTSSIIDAELGSDFLWYPVMGNHEVSDNINNFYQIRDTLVPSLPNIVDYGPTGSVNSTYSWDYGNAHFVSLNGYWDGNTTAGSDTARDGDVVPALNTWLGDDLATNGNTHNFAFIHEPAFPAHRHVGDSLDKYTTNRDNFVSTLNTYNVETLFTGHTHYYEHDVAPEYALGNLDQITNGSLRSGDDTTFIYVLVEGSATTYKVYSWTGSAFTLLDAWSIGGDLPSDPPAAPTGLSALAISHNHIQLTWTDNADNESGFEIERSTTGSSGTFSLLDTVAINEESYYDFGLDPEAEYCYRVRAVNVIGNSDYTNVACDTTPEQPENEAVCESFDGYSPLGYTIGSYSDWYDGGSGPIVTSGIGLLNTVGLDPASAIFTWAAHPFDWKYVSFESISFQMDFQTDNSGNFDDDRMGWMITDSSTDSSNFFGVQLDHSDGGIVTYWRDASDERVQTSIAALPTLPSNTWYRFYALVTKLTTTSARIDVSLSQLDSSGNPTGTAYTGSVADTSTWAGGAPDTKYFNAATMWPAYKNYSAITGNADNSCYETQIGEPPTGSLVGYWRFDEETGSTADDSSEYNNDGSVVGATWTSGKVEGALSFDGDADYVQVPANSSLSLDTNEMTLIGWIYPTDVSGSWNTIIQRANASNDWFDWQLYSRAIDAPTNYHPVFRVDWNENKSVDSDESVEGDIVLAADTWYFIAVTYDGAALKFYINGELVDTTVKVGGEIPNSNHDIWIGANETWGEEFTGKIDEFRIYKVALSIEQIQELMELTEYTLTIISEHGTVTKTPDQATYHYGDEVTLTMGAVDPGWTFTGWTPALVDNKVVIEGDTTVTANFTQNEYTLTIISEHGTVTKTPDQATYHYGDEVTLSMVSVDPGWTFTGWTPALVDNKVVIEGDTTVTANFTQNEYTLTIISEHGTVTKTPDQATYHYGDEVTLSMVSVDPGWTFTGWTPALVDNKVVIEGDTTVTANFTQNEYTLTIISEHGTVTKTPDQATYHYGDEVTLSMGVVDPGWTFTGWTPALVDNKVIIEGDTTVTANFTQNQAPVITEGDSIAIEMTDTFTLTLHATDADNDTLTWSISTSASFGSAFASGTGESVVVDYIPNEGYTGPDSFSVQVDDGNGGIDTIIVNVTIAPVEPLYPYNAFLPVVIN